MCETRVVLVQVNTCVDFVFYCQFMWSHVRTANNGGALKRRDLRTQVGWSRDPR